MLVVARGCLEGLDVRFIYEKKENPLYARFIGGDKLVLENYCFGSRPDIWATTEGGFCYYDIGYLTGVQT
jgi:hypothetical protein